MQPDYVVGKNSKHRNRPCGKCGHALKYGRRYVLDPVKQEAGQPVAYHKECYRQMVARRSS